MITFDYSMTSPAMCYSIDGVFTIHYINAKKKAVTEFTKDNIRIVGHWYDFKKAKQEGIERFSAISDIFLDQIPESLPRLAVVEEYAFGAKGKLATIGENTGILKYKLWKAGFDVRTLNPKTLKLHATGNGGAGKDLMGEAWFNKFGWYLHDNLGCEIKDSPASDIVDAYFIHDAVTSGKI